MQQHRYYIRSQATTQMKFIIRIGHSAWCILSSYYYVNCSARMTGRRNIYVTCNDENVSWNVLIKDLILLITFNASNFNRRRRKTNSNLLHVLVVFARVRLNKTETSPVLFVLSKFPSCHFDDKMLQFHTNYHRNIPFSIA